MDSKRVVRDDYENCLNTRMARYTDLDLGFQPSPLSGDIVPLTETNAIKQSLKNIVLTRKYERPFQPNLYGGVRDLLFEAVTPITAQAIRRVLEDSIRNYEPRAFINSITVSPNIDRNRYDISIIFSVRNVPEPVTLSVFLERLR